MYSHETGIIPRIFGAKSNFQNVLTVIGVLLNWQFGIQLCIPLLFVPKLI